MAVSPSVQRYDEVMHPFMLHNDHLRDTRARELSPGQVGLLNGWGVFSTLRVADGVLFAFERHWARMQRDAQRFKVPMPPDPEALKARLFELIEANGARNATLRVAIVRNHGGAFETPDIEGDFDVIAFTKDLADWGTGVNLAIKRDARFSKSEFAGAKILSWCDNLRWYEEAHERGFDEVILLDEKGNVSECTSANIFAVFGSPGNWNVTTPPLSSGCLPGITREILLQEIRVSGVAIAEKPLRPADLEKAAGVFITSSTRDTLPVLSVEGLKIGRDDSARAQLQYAFETYIQAYVGRYAAAQVG